MKVKEDNCPPGLLPLSTLTSKKIPPPRSSQFLALISKIFVRWDVLTSQRCLSFTFPPQASSVPLLFPLPCFPHVSPPPALFCLPVLPQSSFHSCPPSLPFPFLSSAAVLFSLFLSSFTSMASGSWVKRCRTEPTGGLAYLTAGSNELQHNLASGQMWGRLSEGGGFWHVDGNANQTPRQECHECAVMKPSFQFGLMANLFTFQFIAQHNLLC